MLLKRGQHVVMVCLHTRLSVMRSIRFDKGCADAAIVLMHAGTLDM